MKRLALIAIVLAAGCVKKGDDGFTAAQKKSAGDALGTGIEESAQGFGKVSDGMTADTPCATLSGDTADPDMDSIPNNAKLTYNCSGTNLGFTSVLTGTMGVVDDAPAAVQWAFTGMQDMNWTFSHTNGASIVRDADGMIVSTQMSALGPFKTQRDLAIITTFTGERGAKTVVDEDINWGITFTPMVSWTPGGLIVKGTVNATGTWNIVVGEDSATATLSTPVPLTLEPTCFPRISAGTVVATYVDSNDNTGSITVNWTGCGARTVTTANGPAEGQDGG